MVVLQQIFEAAKNVWSKIYRGLSKSTVVIGTRAT